jgi:putative intracellular protease/amidase
MRRRGWVGLAIWMLATGTHAVASPPTASPRRPLVAVVGENDGTEIADFLVPYAVLAASSVVDVVDVGVHPGPIRLMPATVSLLPRETIASFEARHPTGPDYVIVPAVHHATDPELLRWLRSTAARGVTIVGVCDGAWVLAAAGLLEGRAATGHWYALPSLAKQYPGVHWVRDRRWVRDGRMMTTTGVSAALPAALTLVEEIAGRAHADALAHELGVARWDAAHESARYRLTRPRIATAAANWFAFWRWERIAIPVAPGVDEIALAFTADAWARTYRSSATVVGEGDATVVTRRGLTLRPEPRAPTERMIALPDAEEVGPASVLPWALVAISERYGAATADFVALQLETPFGG